MKKQTLPHLLFVLSAPLPVLGLLYWTSANRVTLAQFCLSALLLYFPWLTYINWRKGGRTELPLFAIISGMYFLYYGLPMFWGDLAIDSDHAPRLELPAETITEALLMAALGVSALWAGMKSGIGHRHSWRNPNFLKLRPSRLNYVRLILVVGTLLSFSDISIYALGSGGRQAMVILISMIPLLAFAILFRQNLRDEATYIDKILIVAFLAVRFIAGMASGWLGVFISIMVICASLYVAERQRIPRLALILVAAFALFFQVGKDDFRQAYWKNQESSSGRVARLTYWVERSFERWNYTLDHPSAENIRETISPSVNRLSLLSQTANVIDKTPGIVPYQYGRLYSYMLVTIIPRFIWPDKPSVNDANQFYQVAYGLTSQDNLGNVSIAVGVLTEGFMNFGWLGVVGVMFLLGVFFDFYQHTFLSKQSGVLLTALGVVLLPQFMAIESQMAQYLGGIVQQIGLALIIMLPALNLSRKPAVKVLSKRPLTPSLP
ncbi:MAG TPA: hypothetical protein VKB46_13385 [Pyrinomonadaceae bacterium]|nr:hypothetical protein [Pyrinomonadaceae bacterium]